MVQGVLDPTEFYTRQSWVTDPGGRSGVLDGLPDGLPALCSIVQGLVLHYMEGGTTGVKISTERRREIDSRWVSVMLEKILELDPRPLTVAREPEQRLVGCCRDSSILLCAMLRHRGVPARIRFGFATYFRPDFSCDHVLCEYWDAAAERWVLVDAEMDEAHCAMNRIDFDPLDVPRDRFLLAGDVWQRCRRADLDPSRCGVDESLTGMGFIGRYVVHDLAALNATEALCWDAWGITDRPPDDDWTADELVTLDRVAALTLTGDEGFAARRELFEADSRLRPAQTINSYSPAGLYMLTVP